VREIEQQIAGALWRRAVARDDLAWQTALLMNATGNFKERITMDTLLGRPPLPLDERRQQPDAAEGDAVADAADDDGQAVRAWMRAAEAQIRASGVRIEGEGEGEGAAS